MSNIVKGSGIIYTTGTPNTIPSTTFDAEFAIDTDGNQYAWNRSTNVWDNIGQGIEIATSSIAPTHTPSKFRPRFVVTPSRDLYFYSGSWGKMNPLPDGVLSGSVDLSRTGIYSGSNVLSMDTNVDIAGLYQLFIGDINGSYYGNPYGLKIHNEGWLFLGNTNESSSRIYINSEIDTTNIYGRNLGLYSGLNSIEMSPEDGTRVLDAFAETGLFYGGDYSTNGYGSQQDRWIPDVGAIQTYLTASYAKNGVKYKSVVLSVRQNGTTTPPSSSYLHNTTGTTFSWDRADVGIYKLTSAVPVFNSDKTQCPSGLYLANGEGTFYRTYVQSADELKVETLDSTLTYVEMYTDQPITLEIKLWD